MASTLHPHKGYIWTREKKPCIKTACSHERTYFLGGVAPDDGKTYVLAEKTFNASAFITFLETMLSCIAGEILLLADNHPVHRSRKVK